jgi:hypothetical protein
VTPTRSRWVPRRGLSATLRRATDLNGRIRLEDVDAVEVVIGAVPGVERLVQVHLEVDVTGVRRRQVAALAGGAGAGAVGAGTVLLLVGVAPAAVIAIPVGVGLAAGGHLAGRSRYRQRTGRVHDAVAGELDLLEHPMALPPPPPRARPSLRPR